MIGPDILERLDVDGKSQVIGAIDILRPLIESQIQQSFVNLLAGSQNESPEVLAGKILQYRQDTTKLQSFLAIPDQLKGL